jgi:DNA-binding SARP family transcriptional activator
VSGSGLSLSLLGGFELRCEGERIELPLATQRVVAFLALHERPVVRSYVWATLWLNKTEDRAAADLRAALWRASRSGIVIVDANRTHLRLARGVEVDVRVAASSARRIVAEGVELQSCQSDTELFSGELLPGWYDDWVIFERERLRHLFINALEGLSLSLSHRGHHALAVDAAIVAVAAEPLRESAHSALIEAHLAAGNRGEAVRGYERLIRLLDSQLGVPPSLAVRARLEPLLRRALRLTTSKGGAVTASGGREKARHRSENDPTLAHLTQWVLPSQVGT